MKTRILWLWKMPIVLGGLALLLVHASPSSCAPAPDDYRLMSAEEMRSKVTRTADYTLDKEVEYDIPLGTALRLKVAKNKLGIGEQFIYPKPEDGRMWIFTNDTSGKRLNRAGWDYNACKGGIVQLATLPCASIVKWQVEGKAAHVHFIISTDKARNRDELEAVYNGNAGLVGSRSFDESWCLPMRISMTDRMTGFVRFWSEAKYNFVFFERMPDLNWDKVLVDYRPRIEKAETLAEYGKVMEECAALLRDGHTNFYGYTGRLRSLPVRVGCIAGRAIILDVTPIPAELTDDDSFPPDTEHRDELLRANFRVGEEILKIDGLTVKEKLDRDIYPYISASTPQDKDYRAYAKLLEGPANSMAVVTVRGLAGQIRNVKVRRLEWAPWPRNEFEFRKIGDDIGYINLPGFSNANVAAQFDKLADKLKGLKGLIIDVRQNGGGDSSVGDRVISHLIDKPLKSSTWKTRQYCPALSAWGEKEGWYKGDQDEVKPSPKKYFLGPIVLLTGPATFSAAEDFTVTLHAGKRVTIVGQKTGGSTGQPLSFRLPMRANARICTKWDTYPDGREFVGVGIIPDVEIGPTPQDIAQGRDAVLEKGIEVLKGLMGGNPK